MIKKKIRVDFRKLSHWLALPWCLSSTRQQSGCVLINLLQQTDTGNIATKIYIKHLRRLNQFWYPEQTHYLSDLGPNCMRLSSAGKRICYLWVKS